MKKLITLSAAALMGLCAFTSCSSDNDNGGDTGDRYSDRTYGNMAIDACADVVTQLTAANTQIGNSSLTAEQQTYLRNTLTHLVDDVIVPTYTSLADEVEALEEELHGLTVNTITQEEINNACQHFLNAREYWERSEAFLGGAASDFEIDPTIDSWPLNRTMLLSYFNSGMPADALGDQSILGFHALEFILFRDGNPRKVSELQGNDTYQNFTGVSGAQELSYAQQICTLLKQRCFQLQVAWEGETTANASRVQEVRNANLKYTTQDRGLSYGQNLKEAGVNSLSTHPTLQGAIAQVLSLTEGSAAAIATEVGTAKIANPFTAGDISYVESPYSHNSITDFQDNIRSIRNVWYGTTDGSVAQYSFHSFFAEISGSNTNTLVEDAINNAITRIGEMPAPFVKYVSTVWNIAFEDDNTYEEYD